MAEDLASLHAKIDRLVLAVANINRRVEQLEHGDHPQESSPPPLPPIAVPPRAESVHTSTVARRPVERATVVTEAKPSSEAIEWEIGGRIFTWLAGVVLILAVGFGIHWVWTTFSLPVWTRVAGLHILSLAILSAGIYVSRQKGLALASQGLLGVGIFALYATAYASLRLYHIWSEPIAFAEFLLITVLAIAIALRADSIGVILLGALGGYLTPFLTATDESNHVALFIYLAFLNVALLSAGSFKGWWIVKPLTFLATAIMFLVWFVRGYQDVDRSSTHALLALHAVIHNLAVLLPPLVARQRTNWGDHVTLVGSTMGYFAGTWLMYGHLDGKGLALLSLLLGAFDLGLAKLLWRQWVERDRLPRVLLGLATGFFLLAVPLYFDDRSFIGLAWCLEGFAFTAVGVYFTDRQLRVSGFVLLLIGTLRLWYVDYFNVPFEPDIHWLANRHLFLLQSGALTVLLSGAIHWFVPRRKIWPIREDEDDARMASILLGAGNFLFLLSFTVQWRDWGLLTFWAADFALLWLAGFAIDLRRVRDYTFVLILFLANIYIITMLVVPQDVSTSVLNARIIALCSLAFVELLAGLAYWRMSKREHRKRSELFNSKDSATVSSFLGNFILLLAVTLEVHHQYHLNDRDLFAGYLDGEMAELATYSICWAIQAAITVALGFRLHYQFYRWFGLGLFAIVILKVFFIDLANINMLPRVIALLILGLALLGTSVLYQRAQHLQEDAERAAVGG